MSNIKSVTDCSGANNKINFENLIVLVTYFYSLNVKKICHPTGLSMAYGMLNDFRNNCFIIVLSSSFDKVEYNMFALKCSAYEYFFICLNRYPFIKLIATRMQTCNYNFLKFTFIFNWDNV